MLRDADKIGDPPPEEAGLLLGVKADWSAAALARQQWTRDQRVVGAAGTEPGRAVRELEQRQDRGEVVARDDLAADPQAVARALPGGRQVLEGPHDRLPV